MQHGLVIYAWCTWIYRLFLFAGIALLVYHMTFKVLGIILAAVEIAFFIGKPVTSEIREWIGMRETIISKGRWRPRLAILAGLVALMFVPFDGRVHVPAVLGANAEQQHFAPEAAQVSEVHVAQRQQVARGDVLLVLSAPELDRQLEQSRLRLELVEQRLQRIAGDSQDRANLAVLQREQAMRLREIDGLEERRRRLVIRADHDGVVTALARGLQPGRWVGPKERLVHVADGSGLVARGVVSEADVERLAVGSHGRFVPDDATLGAVEVTLAAIGTGTSAARELQLLASINGGPVDASQKPSGELHTTAAMFPVRFAANWPARSHARLAARNAWHCGGQRRTGEHCSPVCPASRSRAVEGNGLLTHAHTGP
jgi:putative peptide zinc metalloprotease protein